MRGYALPDLAFLASHPEITELLVVFAPGLQFDLAPVLTLPRLRVLTLSDAAPLDLDRLPALEEFWGVWHPKLRLGKATRLEVLHLRKYPAKTGDLLDFPDLPAVKDLDLVQSPLRTTRGIERLRTLERVQLGHLPKLESLEGLEQLPRLRALDVDVCRKLRVDRELGALKSLHVVRLGDCAPLPSLSFLDDLPALEEFRFVNTNVVDGDLRPLLRLKRVGFLPKRHYSHTPEQIAALIAGRAER